MIGRGLQGHAQELDMEVRVERVERVADEHGRCHI